MASLSIRNIKNEVYQGLKAQAAKEGISMEEKARRMLEQSLEPHEKIGQMFLRLFGSKHGVKVELPQRGRPHHPLKFE